MALVAAVSVLAACSSFQGSQDTGPLPTISTDIGSGALHGAGGTFPAPFYQKAFAAYTEQHRAITVAYDAVGSGAGIQQFTQHAVDFGASDVPMTQQEIDAAGGPDSLVQLPSTIGVIALAYNMPGLDGLKMDGPTVGDIFLGKVRRWDDPELKTLNPGANLPTKDITVVHRSDSSGTSFAFTDYLSKVNDAWKTGVGAAKAVKWPLGTGASGNQGVAQVVQNTQGAIGYVELAYVNQAKLQSFQVRNRAGNWVPPTSAGGTSAGSALIGISPSNFSITEGDGTDAYPISTLSWVMLRTDQSDARKARALAYLWRWMVTGGQPYAASLDYAPLPIDIQNFAQVQLTKIKYGGKPILPYLASTS